MIIFKYVIFILIQVLSLNSVPGSAGDHGPLTKSLGFWAGVGEGVITEEPGGIF